MTSLFGGYSGMGLRLGGQYNVLTKGDIESNIVSVSANYNVRDNIDIFTRYDMVDDNDDINKNTLGFYIFNDMIFIFASVIFSFYNMDFITSPCVLK